MAEPTETQLVERFRKELSKPWAKIAGFGVVAIVVGLVGLNVSARFDPIDVPPTIPIAAPPSTIGGSSTTTSSPLGSTTTDGPGSSTPTPPTSAADLTLDQTQIDFGDSDTVRSLQLTNNGGQPAIWDATSTGIGISVSPSSGTVDSGVSMSIEVVLDRATALEGDVTESVDVAWQTGALTVEVVGSNNQNPVLHNPGANPSTLQVNAGNSCGPTQSTVSLRVRDASPLSSVVLRWGGQETQMIDVGNEIWEGVVGPFSSVATETIRIVAFDEYGNAGGAALTIDVTPCT